jgi:hypothetical protein
MIIPDQLFVQYQIAAYGYDIEIVAKKGSLQSGADLK